MSRDTGCFSFLVGPSLIERDSSFSTADPFEEEMNFLSIFWQVRKHHSFIHSFIE
jgi:hypothetical protein